MIINRKTIIFLVISAIAVLSLGGCGGSSSHNYNSNNKQNDYESMNFAEIYSDSYVYFMGDPNSIDTKNSELLKYFVSLSKDDDGDNNITNINSNDILLVYSFSEADYEKINYALNNYAAIVLLEPNNSKIQKLREATEFTEDEIPNIENGELFSIQIYDDELYVYYIPSDEDKIETETDIVITEETESYDINPVFDDRPAVIPQESENDYDDEIFNDFMTWATKQDLSNEITVSRMKNSVRLSAGSFKETVKKNSANLDFSFKMSSADKYGTPRHLWRINYSTYSLHSFSDGSDYYVVEMLSRSNPTKQYRRTVENLSKTPTQTQQNRTYICSIDVANGYTKELSLKNYFDNNENDEIELVEGYPVGNSTNTNDVINYNFGGTSAYYRTMGGQEFAYLNQEPLQYNHTIINNKTDCTITKNDTAWTLQTALPTDGKDYHARRNITILPRMSYKGLDLSFASTQERNDNFVWIWRVPRDYWQKNGNPKFFKVTANATHGRTEGKGYYSSTLKQYAAKRVDMTWYKSPEKTLNVPLTTPPHIAITGNYMEPSKTSGHYTISLMSEEDWTATSDVSWIKFQQPNGKATTNGIPVLFWFDYDENTTGNNRTGIITIKCNNSGESVKIKVMQSK